MWNESSEDGRIYDGSVDGNVIDGDRFLDGENGVWMVYGCYCGGIFMLEVNGETGFG